MHSSENSTSKNKTMNLHMHTKIKLQVPSIKDGAIYSMSASDSWVKVAINQEGSKMQKKILK